MISIYKSEHVELIKSYQKKLFKYFVFLQSNLFISAIFIGFILYLVGENSIDKLFNQFCTESIVNSTRMQICPSLIGRSSFFNWKNEILHRRISQKSSSNDLVDDFELSRSSQLFQKILSSSRNHSANSIVASLSSLSKLSPIEDVYLLLICLSLINFFLSLILPIFLVKPNRKAPKKPALSTTTPGGAELLPAENKPIILRKFGEKMSFAREFDDEGGFFKVKSKKTADNQDLEVFYFILFFIYIFNFLIFFLNELKKRKKQLTQA